MKRLVIFLMIIVCVLGTSTVTLAATEQDVLNYIKAPYEVNGEVKNVNQDDIIRAERFFQTNKFTSAEYDQILARMKEMLQIMKDEGQIDPTSMTWQSEHRFLTLANEIASVTHTTIKYGKTDSKHGYLIIYDNAGKKLDEIYYTEDNFYKYTGSSDTLLMVIGLGLISAFIGLKYKKKVSF
jgi:hypothetical protein